MAKTLSESQRRAEEAEKERKRKALRGQIETLNCQINSYENQISSLEFKLEQQRAMKMLFAGKNTDLDIEKAAKSVYTENVAQYADNLGFASGYAEVMDDYICGNTARTYQGCYEETSMFMQNEINENQAKLEALQRERNSSISARNELNVRLAKV